MKKGMLLAVVLLLTGCPGPSDRSVDREPAAAFIRGECCLRGVIAGAWRANHGRSNPRW